MASRQAIRNVIRDIFGAVPTSATHGKHAARNGMKELQQTQNGVYLKRYFLDSMDFNVLSDQTHSVLPFKEHLPTKGFSKGSSQKVK